MTEARRQTIATYQTKAKELAAYFDTYGSRRESIARAFALLGKTQQPPKVLELGCGNGRDAQTILEFTSNYLGTDLLPEMLAFAKQALPDQNFVLFDATKDTLPDDRDIIFSFATFLHFDAREIEDFFTRAAPILTRGTVMCISLKYGRYRLTMKKDAFGVREFYYYTPSKIQALAGKNFKLVDATFDVKGEGTRWVTLFLVRM
jgi:SAM-dependent methyltransferase